MTQPAMIPGQLAIEVIDGGDPLLGALPEDVPGMNIKNKTGVTIQITSGTSANPTSLAIDVPDENEMAIMPHSKQDDIVVEAVKYSSFEPHFYAATSDDRLWWRDAVDKDIAWDHISHAHNVIGMTSIYGILFAVDNNERIWWRDPVGHDVDWQHIGHAPKSISAMTAWDGKLYAADLAGKVWRRKPVGRDVGWMHWDTVAPLGKAASVTGLAATNDTLFATTTNNIWWRDLGGDDFVWEHIGHAPNVRAMTAWNGKLYAADHENRLLQRKPVGRDVTWKHIGHAYNVVGLAAFGGLGRETLPSQFDIDVGGATADAGRHYYEFTADGLTLA